MQFPLDTKAANAALKKYSDDVGADERLVVWDTIGGQITDRLENAALEMSQRTDLSWWEAVLVIVGTLKDRAEGGALAPATKQYVVSTANDEGLNSSP